MSNNEFVYTTYIKTTPEKLWEAITNPEFSKQYWGGAENESDWKKDSKWSHNFLENGKKEAWVVGTVVESNPPKRLVLTWADPDKPSDISRVTFDIEKINDLVKLDVVHGSFMEGSDMAGKVKAGWPLVLSSLKSFLESGTPIDIRTAKGPCRK